MQRRKFLGKSTIAGAAMLAGCTTSSDETGDPEDNNIKDSDGDGVIDSEDYAPQDSEVQEKSDLEDVTSTTRKTTTSTSTSQPTTTQTQTPTSTSTPTTTRITTERTTTESASSVGSIRVDESEFPQTVSHFVEYSGDSARVSVHPEGPAVSKTSNRELWVIAADYTGESIYGTGRAPVDFGSSQSEVVVDVEWDSMPKDQPLYYWAMLAPEGSSMSELSGDNTDYLTETDAFIIGSSFGMMERATISELENLGDDEGDRHERTNREGEFLLNFSGRTNGESWDVGFTVYKSAYVQAVQRDHGRRRSQFVTYEMANGFAGELANILSEEADENNYSGKREQVEFIIDFVQHLPYVPDDVSTDYDDYTKYGAETLVELGGDCEDSAILLASILQSEPFGYDMILIQPPEHMAAGIYGEDDMPGYYWEHDGRKYYYIETTGVGWEIGDLPDAYKDESAYVHPV